MIPFEYVPIIIFIVAVGSVGYTLYFLFLKPPKTATLEPIIYEDCEINILDGNVYHRFRGALTSAEMEANPRVLKSLSSYLQLDDDGKNPISFLEKHRKDFYFTAIRHGYQNALVISSENLRDPKFSPLLTGGGGLRFKRLGQEVAQTVKIDGVGWVYPIPKGYVPSKQFDYIVFIAPKPLEGEIDTKLYDKMRIVGETVVNLKMLDELRTRAETAEANER